jgi:hypothetical protein
MGYLVSTFHWYNPKPEKYKWRSNCLPLALEQISYECEKRRHTALSQHNIEKIHSTNHIAKITTDPIRMVWHGTITVKALHGTAHLYHRLLTVSEICFKDVRGQMFQH